MKIHYLFLFIFLTMDTTIITIQWSSVLIEKTPQLEKLHAVLFEWSCIYSGSSSLWLVFPLFLSRVLTYICCTVSAVCASGISPVQYVEETRAHDISISNKKLSNTASPLFLKWILLSAIAVCRGAADKQLVHKGQTITETAAALQRDQGINP